MEELIRCPFLYAWGEWFKFAPRVTDTLGSGYPISLCSCLPLVWEAGVLPSCFMGNGRLVPAVFDTVQASDYVLELVLDPRERVTHSDDDVLGGS